MQKRTLALVVFCATVITGCATPTTPPRTSMAREIPEVRPGILEGYLSEAELPDSLALLPPPPAEGSVAFEVDQAVAARYVALQDDARKTQAVRDNVLAFPEATEAFSGILNTPLSEDATPHVYMILRRTVADAGLSTYAAKNHYRRPRPFMVTRTPTLTPEEEEHLRVDGSYPSGHTAVGWAWALILTELYPEHTDELLDRGIEFGISRMVCNVHWHSDVEAGRTMGAATVARLHADEQFLIDLEAAKQEIRQLSAGMRTRELQEFKESPL